MTDRSALIGTSQPRTIEVEAGFLKLFAMATGETDPIYFDEQAARAAGYPAIPMPPTYLFSLQMAMPAARGDLFDPVNGFGVDLRRVLHGEQGFTHHHPICAGDRITMTTTTRDVYEKKGGALEFIVQETRFENQDGILCGEARQVTLVRHG